jgi:competence protein ComEA
MALRSDLGGVFMKYNRIFFLWMLMCAGVLSGCSKEQVLMTLQEDSEVSAEVEQGDTDTEEETSQLIYVYVCGYVNQPGVYSLEPDARICDALALAGGVTEDGRGEALNQAEHLTDGQTLYVPGREETSDGTAEEEADDRVNINTADKEALMTLPGIGESKAETIIQYRDEHGSFDSIEKLMEIPGIKEGVYNKVKNQIKV